MHDVLLMHVIKGQEYLPDNVCCLAFTKSLDLHYMIAKFTTTDELRDNVKILIIFVELEVPNDVRVICFS